MVWIYVLATLLFVSSVYGAPAVIDPVAAGNTTVSVPENTATGTTIFTVLPTTPGRTYVLSPAGTPFSINIGGTVQVNGLLDFDSAPTSYSLTIFTTDGTGTTNRTLTVQLTNVFEETPTFAGTTTATVNEEDAVGTTVTGANPATDVETGSGDVLTYSILGPGAAYFNIDPTTGTTTIATRIDYDAGVTPLSFTIQVTDRGGNVATQAITVTVNDINDNTPICSPGVVYPAVPENTATGSKRYTIANVATGCTDSDGTSPNRDITYSIFSGDDTTPNEKFSLTGTTLATTTVSLDYETKQTYTLVIRATDGGTGPNTGTVTYIIQVGAVNDNTPAWGTNVPLGTAFSVQESSPTGTSIVTIAATDADLGTDGALTYSIISTTPNVGAPTSNIFLLDAATSELSTLAALDRETVQSYDVVVRASDGGTPAQFVDDTLTITITDYNDNAPIFTAASVLTGTVVEGAPSGTSILTLVASDADATSTLTFLVTAGDTIPPNFQFNTGTLGQLEVADVIDLDQPTNDPASYSLTVIVTDGGTPELTGTTYVTVTVTPANNHVPVMNTPAPSATVSIAEDTGTGTSGATVTGTDDDFGVDGTLTYSITGGNTGTKFSIDPTLGEIRTQAALDYDLGTRQFLLEVTATDGGKPANVASTTVTIDVTNVNDNTPTCTRNPITVFMAEADTAPTAVTTLTCSDGDPTDTLTYTITAGNAPVFFSITGAAIQTTQAFNYEGTTSYTLTVNVADNGTTSKFIDVTVNVLVTPVNEFAPVFAPATYTANVIETATTGTNVVQVMATDADVGALDGTVRYSITAGDRQGRFAIDLTTGQITVVNSLDRESTLVYTLTVTATDDVPGSATQRVVTTSVTVNIDDFNDNAPLFNPVFYTASTIESSAAVSVIQTVTATDDDLAADPNSNIVFTIDPAGDPTGIFEFSNADLRIAAGKSLNYATTPTYDLTIIATDQGAIPLSSTARIVINVQPANLNSPMFTNQNQNISILESTAVGTTVLTATATDPDSGLFGIVSYSIISGNIPADSFVIGGTTGDILVWSQLDYDIPPTFFNLTLEATDGGGTTTDTWLYIDLIDVNDNYPQFASNVFNIAINENLATSTSIAQIVATDKDTGTNGEINYSFTTGDGLAYFAIDLTTGDITTTAALDYETKVNYSLVIQAIDKGTPTANSATAYVVITLNDLNDNTPIFSPADFAIDLDENVAIGAPVVTMAATDADSTANSNGLFTYNIVDTKFTIDANTGAITTLLNIDRETFSSHVVIVTATDQSGVGPNVGTGTVTINILDKNDNAPAITGTYVKTLPENTVVNTIIYTIAATDADSGRNAQLTFAITGGNTNNAFRIESSSGILQLDKPLDRETTPSYTLTVTVTDNGVTSLASTVTVSLTISDTNDNNPIFQGLPYTFSISENVPAGSGVGTVTALDADTGVNGAVVYDFVMFWQGNQTHFSVHGSTGAITVNGGLDRETLDTYIIWLRASDNGVPIRSADLNITITILDLNDNNPVFNAASYSGSVSESAANGTSVLTIGVTDNDIGPNAAVTLSIDTTAAAGTRANTFLTLDSATGELSLLTAVDRETDPSFTFHVLAIDGGGTPRTSTTTVTVTVTDVNDNAPVLSPTFYNTEAAYNGICKKTITTVTATDADTGVNGLIVYYLIASSYNYLFSIDSSSGVYSLQSKAPNNQKFFIQASVRDSGASVFNAITPATIRTDTFDANVVVVTFKLSVDQATFQAQEASFVANLQALIRVTYPTAMFRVWCVELSSTTPSPAWRRLLQTTGTVDVHTYTVADSSTNSAANTNVGKTFLTSGQTQAFFATNPQGSPSAAITAGNLSTFAIQSVTPYYQTVTPWAQTAAGIAVLTVISFVILALIITGIIVAVVTCRKRNRRKPVTPVRKSLTFPYKGPTKVTRPTIATVPDIDAIKKRPPPALMSLPLPTFSVKPLPMKAGDDGISNLQPDRGLYRNFELDSNNTGRVVLNRDFEGTAVDEETGRVYKYNTRTNERQWLTTPEGRSVKVTHH